MTSSAAAAIAVDVATERVSFVRRWAWAEISLAAIAANIARVRTLLRPHVGVMAVVKGNGYGHGAVPVARAALAAGAHTLSVGSLGEAVELREAGITAPVLLLGASLPADAPPIAEHGLTATVFDVELAEALAAAGRRRPRPVKVHVKIDTGLHRLGIMPEEAVAFAERLGRLPGLELDGIFTQLATPDIVDERQTREQIAVFDAVLRRVRAAVPIPCAHAGNSAAAAWYPEAHYDMVRLGLAMYGVAPSAERAYPVPLTSALTLKTRVTRVRELAAGSRVGYGAVPMPQARPRVATLAIGYADGLRRGPRGWPGALVAGARAAIVEPVCMDQTIVDVSDDRPVRVGDEAVLLDDREDRGLGAVAVAAAIGTIPEEVLTALSRRLERVYDVERNGAG